MAKLYCHSYFLPFAVQELFHAVLCGNAKPTDILKQIWKLGFPQNSLRSSFSPDSWNSKLSSHSHVLRTNSNLSFSDVRNCCFLSILDVGEFGFWYNTNQVSSGRNSPLFSKSSHRCSHPLGYLRFSHLYFASATQYPSPYFWSCFLVAWYRVLCYKKLYDY